MTFGIASAEPLLAVDDLRVEFGRSGRGSTALAGVTLDIGRGEILGVVGETGCGKTMTALAILGLLPKGARRTSGRIRFEGDDLLKRREGELRRIRGKRIGMVFQNPASAFNPVFTIGDQIGFVIDAHLRLDRRARGDRIRASLREAGLADPDAVARSYPHQLSGGMLQRAMIASALVCRPSLLIADEPTTALDVTIQAEILALLRRLQQERVFSVLYISHDLGVVAALCDRVAVLYAGRVVEIADTAVLLDSPHHPYTRGLLDSIPGAGTRGAHLRSIPGNVPTDAGRVIGCAFAPRCAHAQERCRSAPPPVQAFGGGHESACILPGLTEAPPVAMDTLA